MDKAPTALKILIFNHFPQMFRVRPVFVQFGLRPAYSKCCKDVPRPLPDCAGNLQNENYEEMTTMKTLILNSLNRLHKDEAGQGLVEYLLILALVAFAATAGMTTLASGLNSAFSQIGIILGKY